jgi:hypothetical protein
MPRNAQSRRRNTRPVCLSRYVYIKARDQFFDRQTRDFHTLRALGRAHADELPRATSPTEFFLSGPDAVQKADGVTFWPGQSEFVEEDGGTRLNLWRDPGLVARAGCVEPFTQHVERMLDGDETAINFVLDFFAHLVQRPGQKMRFALLIIGSQGTGKSMLANFAQALVGKDNTKTLGPMALVADHNEWVQAAQLALVHELVGDKSRTAAARLKELITEDTILVNPTGVSAYEVRNQANFILLSNEDDAAKLDPDDRRYFVWKSRATQHPDPDYYRQLQAWFDGDGKEYVLHFLLTRDLSRFDPFRAPPKTEARAELVDASRDPHHEYLRDRLQAVQAPFACDLVTLADLRDYLAVHKQMRLDTKALAKILKTLGAEELGQKRINGTKPRIWAVRNLERWAVATEQEITGAFYKPEAQPLPGQPVRRTVNLDLNGI